ncbi:multifunctional CCA addition/repair protein [Massilia niastensis]|uniref:multifunctional CCA addition/repair protein n=1 Tax=Massilia niastensis TaxID=544911 RepID=UPI00036E6420|nr:multifunctional CCA addition/repair protein [Massilia niastensis]
MRSYVVGGAVRDELLGLPVQDHDHVVVGATPEQMVAAGFRPVGKDFPVFLHPGTQEEYALARTERKTAPGYRGFAFHAAPDVTLEQDLVRRDLTINAMARDEDGAIVDPYGGRQDLEQRLFRHVSGAFAEDPVRILRVARFAARLPEFRVAETTNALMRRMVEEGEADALVPERVWQELARGLMEQRPSRMLEVLRDCGALAHILPELDALWGAHLLLVIDYAAECGYPLEIRFAALVHGLGQGASAPGQQPAGHGLDPIRALCQRLKAPNECRDLALMTAREHGNIGRAQALPADAIVTLFERCDAFRKPERFAQMLQAAECDAHGRGGAQHALRSRPYPQGLHLLRALAAARAVNAGEIAQRHVENKDKIPEAIHAARVRAVGEALGDVR